uniref:Uncharacterized protein n=1 Tax=Lepeophtheirus salmonis TaxID=72036 RepID=A0A0K2V1D4_LEPSM
MLYHCECILHTILEGIVPLSLELSCVEYGGLKGINSPYFTFLSTKRKNATKKFAMYTGSFMLYNSGPSNFVLV